MRRRSLDLAAGRADYKTDYILAGRSWTTLDDASPKRGYSSAIWTTLDDPGQRAECSNTAECRFDSYPICPTLDVDDPEATWPVSTPMELGIAARVAAS